jgi:hypothetical protein
MTLKGTSLLLEHASGKSKPASGRFVMVGVVVVEMSGADVETLTSGTISTPHTS